MPTTYKGLTIPVSSDLADGPQAFASYTDSLPFQVFANAAARDLWTNPPNGAMCVTANDWHRWVYRSNVWMDVTSLTQQRGLVGGTIGTTAVPQGSLGIPAVPYPRRMQVSAFLLVTGAEDSVFEFSWSCAGAASAAIVRGTGDGTIAIPAYTYTLNANAIGDITSSVRRLTGNTNGNASGDARFSHLDVTYSGLGA